MLFFLKFYNLFVNLKRVIIKGKTKTTIDQNIKSKLTNIVAIHYIKIISWIFEYNPGFLN